MTRKEMLDLIKQIISRLEGNEAIALKKLATDFVDCRNELCLECGNYKSKYTGACEGCRWKND